MAGAVTRGASAISEAGEFMELLGFPRQDGRVGVRNHVLVLPLSYEVNQAVRRISALAPGSVTFYHQHGVGQSGDDLAQTLRVFEGFATHPNVSGVVLVTWGHEPFDPARIAASAAQAGKRVEWV
ncbi:MAG: UxaA family hydrolase, partial [Alicyclobacillus sp.]|nr:UxaA family hydrolase [Alicyclobacillus sp.]